MSSNQDRADAFAKPVAIVTGAGGGIGAAITRRLAADGFHVAAVDISDKALASVVDSVLSAGGSVEAAVVDLRDEAAVSTFVARLPRVDAVVNNAGVFDERAFMNLTAEDFMRHYDLNVIALFRMARCAAARLPSGGKIVNIASRAYLGARNHAHYVAAKAAVVGLTRAMAMELLDRGVLVNAVAPGLVDTPMLQALTPERRAAQLALQPTGRAARPEDIANAVAFLAAPHTDFITGQILMVDGGKSLGGTAAL
ncbi:SDR family NAD(P)-dependent oxidoreductase [Paraburkholderia bannensis]|uniref:SDR family NAD(P)-dependent oxidoreductase n=1 Tax=Paraburkholderia bannensis TaxID=765414 RepID=UPI002AB16A00|nr:SDR family NAD(P)-dependent oxidoreductase [Paraburkholderia bannensis]